MEDGHIYRQRSNKPSSTEARRPWSPVSYCCNFNLIHTVAMKYLCHLQGVVSEFLFTCVLLLLFFCGPSTTEFRIDFNNLHPQSHSPSWALHSHLLLITVLWLKEHQWSYVLDSNTLRGRSGGEGATGAWACLNTCVCVYVCMFMCKTISWGVSHRSAGSHVAVPWQTCAPPLWIRTFGFPELRLHVAASFLKLWPSSAVSFCMLSTSVRWEPDTMLDDVKNGGRVIQREEVKATGN